MSSNAYWRPAGPTMLYMGISGIALYGAFFVLFLISLWVIMVRRREGRGNLWLEVALLSIFVFTTTSVCLSLRVVTSIILSSDGPSSTTLEVFLGDGGKPWATVLEGVVSGLNMLTADAVLIYRAWMVWNKRWLMVSFNIAVSLAAVASWMRLLQLAVLCVQEPGNMSLYQQEVNWLFAFLILSLAQTVTATLLIACRLWMVDRRAAVLKSRSFGSNIRILVESGSVYAVTLLAYVIVNSVPAAVVVNFGFTEIVRPPPEPQMHAWDA